MKFIKKVTYNNGMFTIIYPMVAFCDDIIPQDYIMGDTIHLYRGISYDKH